MAANRSLEDGLAILRYIAESDAIKQVRGRIRDGASRVAENDRVPRVIAGSAGILAALLSDVEEPDTDAYPDDLPSYDESSEMQMPSTDLDDDEDDDEAPESTATVRDLEGAASLDSPLEEEPDDGEDEAGVLLPYDAYEVSKHEDLMAEEVPQPSTGGTKPAKGQAKPEAKSASRAKGKKPSGKKTPTVKPTKSANAAKGAARKAAVKRKKPDGAESVSGQSKDAGTPKPANKPARSKAAKATKATKAIKATKSAQGKPTSKPAKPRVVKRPAEKSATKGDLAGGKKST